MELVRFEDSEWLMEKEKGPVGGVVNSTLPPLARRYSIKQ
jgi:hypothetical protein